MYTKRAVIVDSTLPVVAHLDCECGRTHSVLDYPRGPDVVCPCGITYNNHGWIISRRVSEIQKARALLGMPFADQPE